MDNRENSSASHEKNNEEIHSLKEKLQEKLDELKRLDPKASEGDRMEAEELQLDIQLILVQMEYAENGIDPNIAKLEWELNGLRKEYTEAFVQYEMLDRRNLTQEYHQFEKENLEEDLAVLQQKIAIVVKEIQNRR